MTKDEIIRQQRKEIESLKALIENLTAQTREQAVAIRQLTAQVASLEELLTGQKRVSKALGNMVNGRKSERQEPVKTLSKEEAEAKKKAQEEARKKRGNNGAKRDPHLEVETVEVDLYPEGKTAEMWSKMRELDVRQVVRYEMIPARFVKTIYNMHVYVDKDGIYEPKAPLAAFLNSSYDPSFVAGLIELRYIHAMPAERIVKYFTDHGFNLRKPTANKLLGRAAEVLENLYKAMRQTVLEQDYVNFDETFHKVLTREADGKGVMKGYMWGALAQAANLFCLWYSKGSRAGEVLTSEFGGYKGYFQSDAYTIYRRLESDEYPDMTRIACLQHIKRKFLDCGEDDRDAMGVVGIINRFYRCEHRHKVGEDGWTVDDNLRYRRKYAPPILEKLKTELDALKAKTEQLPKSALAAAVGYALNEYAAACNIFTRGDTALDNNAIERCNRYVSLSRRNSMFFGSHEGAKRGCILYSIAISCRQNNVKIFDYIQDVLRKTADWQPNTPLERYRDLLPDRWSPSN